MIEVDGSYGEGGGQIVRTAVALSSVTGSPVRIRNIRKGRTRPGLTHQHVRAIEALALLTGARKSGVLVGSDEITFEPNFIRGGNYRIDIGTAGSITLLLQCLLPAIVYASEKVLLEVRGGTDVAWSPTIDYLRHVALLAFSRFGVRCNLTCKRRGYYPRGGGSATVEVHPGKLIPAHLKAEKLSHVRGITHCSNLPEHVADRQGKSACQVLEDAGYRVEMDMEVLKCPSTGSGITLWAGYKGGSALGKRGVSALVVGSTAANELLFELESDASVDVHLGDQLIPYLVLAGGSFTVREITRHARTNIWTARHFVDVDVSVTENGIFKVEVDRGQQND
jgi:RNA 3'-terminal phosphate cyclase (ATP)